MCRKKKIKCDGKVPSCVRRMLRDLTILGRQTTSLHTLPKLQDGMRFHASGEEAPATKRVS